MVTLRETDTKVVDELLAKGYEPLVARVLAARSLSNPKLLEPDIQTVDVAADSTTDAAAKAIIAAIDAKKKICICGDFDTDGVCATALLKLGLEAIGADCQYLVASHNYANRSLDPTMVRKAAELGAQLIITVDCGTSAHDSVALAQKLDMEVIVTDHHLVDQPVKADYLINSHLPDSGFTCTEICGTAIAFLLLKAVYRRSGSRKRASRFLDLVAVATIGDMMPLDKEYNRALASEGLGMINKQRCRPFFTAVLNNRYATTCTSSKVSFKIAPLLNCAHRMGEPELAVEALLVDDISSAHSYLNELNALNRERKLMQQRMTREATKQLTQPVEGAVVVHDSSWKPGILGLVAGELARKFKLPAAVLTSKNGNYRCSIRSGNGISVHAVLVQLTKDCPELLADFGGHHAAGGCTVIGTDDGLERFRKNFVLLCTNSERNLSEQLIDAQPSADELTSEAIDQLESMPWGADQPEPIFANDFYVTGTREISSGFMHDLELDGMTFTAWSSSDLSSLGDLVSLCFQAVSSNKGSPMLMVKTATSA